MWKRILVAGIIISPLCAPARSYAQREDPEDFNRDVLRAFLHSSWNVYLHGGLTNHSRFMLQRPGPAVPGAGERALRSEGGYNVGIGAGVDILLRTGFRMSYTYSSNDLNFRTDNGDGSFDLDINDVASLSSHTVTAEIIRYMLPARSGFTPYGSAGFVGTWWGLDQTTELVVPAGGSTQFRFGAIGSIGLQAKLAENWFLRLEDAFATIRSPFTGDESFRALGGATIDEPTRITKTDFRLAAVYRFGKPHQPRAAVTTRRRSGRR
jgi:opacity protein-like surface antigen